MTRIVTAVLMNHQGSRGWSRSFSGRSRNTITAMTAATNATNQPGQEVESANFANVAFSRTRLEELCKKRFFYAPSFSIYGGVAGLFDYGPPGCALQANILSLWRNHFILEENMLEMDTTIMTPHDVLKASGHVDRFTDFMVRDTKTGDFYRADHLLEAVLEKRLNDAATKPEENQEYENILAQIDGYTEPQLQDMITRFGVKSDLGNDLTPVVRFNLMFASEIGPTGQLKGFLRPETAQGQFTNFKRLLECNNEKMPFASAQIGKSFRNEISPRSGLLRVREFTMAEIEHYVHPQRKNHARFHEVANVVLPFLPSSIQQEGSSEAVLMTVGEAVRKGTVNNETLGYFLARTAMFMWKIGIDPKRIRFRQHLPNEMSHYASDCWDCEIKSSYGWVECVGCADRSAYDLTMHTQWTKEKLVVREKLPEPKTINVKRLEISKKDIGIAFKKDSKDIVEKLERMTLCQAEDFMAKADAEGNVPIRLEGSPEVIKLTPAMVSLVEKTETVHVDEYTPNVIEPSFGIGRIMYSLLEHSLNMREGDEQRCVLSFPAIIAPTKALIAPLSNHEEFAPFCRQLVQAIRRRDLSCQLDESSTSIGKRYARNDEIGVPFALTVDFQTLKDSTVTLRERDTTQQVRLAIDEAPAVIESLVRGSLTWTDVVAQYGLFTA